MPGFVTDIGPRRGKRASWIRAFGDQTFIKLDESLVSDEQFNRSTILASKQYFGNSFNSTLILGFKDVNLVFNSAQSFCQRTLNRPLTTWLYAEVTVNAEALPDRNKWISGTLWSLGILCTVFFGGINSSLRDKNVMSRVFRIVYK